MTLYLSWPLKNSINIEYYRGWLGALTKFTHGAGYWRKLRTRYFSSKALSSRKNFIFWFWQIASELFGYLSAVFYLFELWRSVNLLSQGLGLIFLLQLAEWIKTSSAEAGNVSKALCGDISKHCQSTRYISRISAYIWISWFPVHVRMLSSTHSSFFFHFELTWAC